MEGMGNIGEEEGNKHIEGEEEEGEEEEEGGAQSSSMAPLQEAVAWIQCNPQGNWTMVAVSIWTTSPTLTWIAGSR